MLLFPAQPKYLSAHVSETNHTWPKCQQTSPRETSAPSPSAAGWSLASYSRDYSALYKDDWTGEVSVCQG
jgi:hypothetical protein